MKRSKSRFDSSRFATPIPSPIECKRHGFDPLPLLLTMRTAIFDPLVTILLRAEISFLVTLAVFTGMYIAKLYALQREVPTDVGFRAQEFIHCPQGTSGPLQADHPTTITRLSFTPLNWPSTGPPPSPSSLTREVAYLGPDALLDDDSVASCFAFSGSSGGAVLVSTSGKYAVTQFTLDNSVVDTVVDSIYYPKEGALWGLFEGPLPEGLKNATSSSVAEHMVYVIIGNFCFSLERGLVQTFAIDDSIASFPTIKFSVFYLEVLSNWGGSHTCLGRIRLHGNPLID